MIRYRLNGSLSPMREEEEYGRNVVRIELMTIQEFEADKGQIPHKKLLLRQLEQIQYCKAEIFGSCIIGTFAVPNVKNLPGKKESFGFHMVKDRLIFVEGGGEHVRSIFERMREIQFGEQGSMSAFFTGFLNYLIEGDSIFLPLTLLVGWYGMNFTNMPELTWKYGYPAVGVLSIIIIILEIRFFRKRNLL